MAWPAHHGLLPLLLHTPLLYHQEEYDGNEMKIFNKCVKMQSKSRSAVFPKITQVFLAHNKPDQRPSLLPIAQS